MKDELVALQEKITVAEKTAKDADASVKTLEKEMREFATNRDGKIKKIEKEVAAAKADLSKRNIAFKGKQRELLTCRQDKEALEVELREASLLLESSGAALKALIIEEQTLAKEEASIKVGWMASCCGLLLLTHVRAHSTRTHTHTHTQSQYETMNAELQKQSRLYVKFDKDLKRLDDARKEATENLNEVQIEYKRLVHEMERFSREKEAARESVEAMLVEFEWIAEQEEYVRGWRWSEYFTDDTNPPSLLETLVGPIPRSTSPLRTPTNVVSVCVSSSKNMIRFARKLM